MERQSNLDLGCNFIGNVDNSFVSFDKIERLVLAYNMTSFAKMYLTPILCPISKEKRMTPYFRLFSVKAGLLNLTQYYILVVSPLC